MDPARAVFEDTMIWEPMRTPVPVARLTEGFAAPDVRFIELAYGMSERLYAELPPRKNGEPAFTHPTNVALYLKYAVAQPHVIACGLLHDVLEDRVDREKRARGGGILELDDLVMKIRGEFATDIVQLCDRSLFPRDLAERVVEVAWTLTRHKADLYYKSINGVFTHTDVSVRIAAALVKLSDRMHNIQTIENYDDDEKLYQCFKNLFILNNAKQLLAEVRARNWDKRMILTLEKLYKKSGKAVFQALIRMEHDSHADERLFPLVTYLALALRKFTWEIQGLWRVVDGKLEPGVPVYQLFHGIVKKYDHRLHKEDDQFEAHVRSELDYCLATFATLGLSEDDFRRALCYKDAMALAEVVASLLYREDYVIRGFECSRLCRRGRNCMKLDRPGAGL